MKEDHLPQNRDRHLNTPSEANRDKHINFVEQESADESSRMDRKDKETKDRQQEWKEGIKEGKQHRNS